MSQTSPVVEVVGVTKRFGSQTVLRNVTFQAGPGETLGITGENGSGKSTLLRIVVGLLRPTAGVVRLRGRLGYCDQEPQVSPGLTVAEHFRYFARAYALSPAQWLPMRDVYGCYGLLVGTVFRRDLDSVFAILVLINIDAGWLQNPLYYAAARNQRLIEALPAHWPSQVSYLGAFTGEPVSGPALRGLAYGCAFLALAVAAYALRLRVKR